MAALMPFYVMAVYGGWRSIRALWPVLLVAGAVSHRAVHRLQLHRLRADQCAVLAELAAVTLLFLRVWRPAPDEEFMIKDDPLTKGPAGERSAGLAGLDSMGDHIGHRDAVELLQSSALLQQNIPWPHLHQAIAITLYQDRPYAAVWNFQPMATGTAILVSCLITSLLVRLSLQEFFGTAWQKTMRQAGSRSSP
jgi:lactate permease